VTLDSLMTLSTPLAVQLPRQPGHKEVRYAQLLAGEPQVPVAEPPAVHPEEAADRLGDLERSIASLRAELAQLRDRFEEFRQQF
jgi:uncharacterized protein YceH (UPF0502 family)